MAHVPSRSGQISTTHDYLNTANAAGQLSVRIRSPRSFCYTIIGQWLRDHEIDTLTVVGYMTYNCDVSTRKNLKLQEPFRGIK
ncbi:hypothetical protein WCLP8_2750002 [uncultured Gammaproteobacteria bacterium]